MQNRRIALSGVLLLLVAAACHETGLVPTLAQPALPLVPDAPARAARIPFTCSVAVRESTMRCDVERGAASLLPKGISPAIIIGGQNVYLRLASQATSYDAASSVLSSAVSITNLLSQPLGTVDGVTRDTSGVRVFFHAGPTVTGGTGTVTVRNPDGTDTFTASAQPYFAYTEIISGNGTSSLKTWQFLMPSTVTSFTFSVYVQATLRDETLPLTQPAHNFGGGQISAGSSAACAIRINAGVYCWGSNAGGRLGIGSTNTYRPFSAMIGPILSGIATGSSANHSCALNTAGAAYCWGTNSEGQLGDGTFIGRTAPTAVTMPSGVTFARIYVGSTHSCALTSLGDAYCWGSNIIGELGDGTTVPHSAPVATATGLTFSSLALGTSHSCGLRSTGDAYCWGPNGNGQMGDGTATTHLTPSPVTMPSGVTFTSLAASNGFTCALATSGVQYCWGTNGSGSIGDGTTATRTVPTAATMPSGVTFSAVTVGSAFSCGLSTTGAVYCSGVNGAGQLGDGTGVLRTTPTAATMPAGVTFTAVTGGNNHACALDTTGAAYCWGENNSGQVGDRTTTFRLAPVPVSMPAGVAFATIGGGAFHTCATTADSLTYCWGNGTLGQLGTVMAPAIGSSTKPLLAPGTHLITSLAVGPNAPHTCGLTSGGAAFCWGTGSSSQLGDGTNVSRSVATGVTMPVGQTFSAVGVGTAFSCGLTIDGAVYCWGNNGNTQLGDGTTSTRSTPKATTMPASTTFTTIALGSAFACGLSSAGASYCWGQNSNSQLGIGGTSTKTTPFPTTMPVGVTFSSLALATATSCALSSGVAYCWGSGGNGQTGSGNLTRSTPTMVTMPVGVTFSAITAGVNHFCALSATGDAYCWGLNTSGQLGDGTTSNRLAPTLASMPSGITFASLTAGSAFTCALTTTNESYCWGANASGQLGDGTTTAHLLPAPTALP